MGAEETGGSPVTNTYRALRGVFTAGLKGFYNTVEVGVFSRRSELMRRKRLLSMGLVFHRGEAGGKGSGPAFERCGHAIKNPPAGGSYNTVGSFLVQAQLLGSSVDAVCFLAHTPPVSLDKFINRFPFFFHILLLCREDL